jgi:para-aminobenzoate synthetase component 1
VGVDASGAIEARPIKGTRARHADPSRDAMLLAELLGSDKDRAENLMIVDLLRHDISRVARIGSVHVPELAVAESFAHVHHLVSSVRGRLRPDATATDLLQACFAPGSVTGAPKHRAMQIIHELEPAARGPYCGAIFWAGWDGAMDSAVAIRTATISPACVTLQAGGGIVADSDPAAEYDEMMVKAGPLLRALEA